MRELLFNLTIFLLANPEHEQLEISQLQEKYEEIYGKVDKIDLKQAMDCIIFGTIQDVQDFADDYELLNRYNNEKM
jgi:hypothetical protein